MAGASLPGRRMPALAHRDAPAHRLSRRRRQGPRRGARDHRTIDQGAQSRLGRRCSATRPKFCPSWCAAASGPTSSPTRPPRTIRSTAICPKGWTLARVGGAPRERSRRASSAPRKSVDGRARARDARFPPRRRSDRRLRQQHPPDGARGRRRGRVRFSRASCPPISGRCSAAASGRSAGRRCRAIPRTSSAPTPRSRS